ncbi:type 1 glutamine amidotransferase family protein [Tessaracoccus sp.]|uniref:hypothetical protein n=1 Tax=Tessaracoccus sp. TaxID=1971211 RepID=UPI00261D05EE|nr:hypothetical protein [Tessaracoccus sp.]
MTRPFLLLSTRPEDDAVAGEREAILSKAGLEEAELVQHRVERFPLPELNLDDYSGVLLGGGPFNASDEDKSELQLRVEADIAQVVVQAVEREVPPWASATESARSPRRWAASSTARTASPWVSST